MDYRAIIRSSVSWISADKIAWFIAFFWISLPFLVLMPSIFEKNVIYTELTKPIAFALYDVLYFVFLLGIIVLIQHALASKREPICEISFEKLFSLFFLVFYEMVHIFLWSLHASYRVLQLLFLIASILGVFFYAYYPSGLSFWLLYALLTGYFFFVVYNSLRLFFSTTLFFSRDTSSKSALFDSWALTHSKFKKVVRVVFLIFIICFLLFAFIIVALGAFTSLLLGFFFIDSIAMLIGFRAAFAFALGIVIIAYHFCVAEAYSQLFVHAESSSRIKRILAKKVLSSSKYPMRKLAKKKKRK